MFKLKKIEALIVSEIVSLSLVIMATLSSIMFMIKIPVFAEFIFSSPNLGTTIISFLVYTFPTIFKLTLPVSLLLSCTIVAMRMSADREMEAAFAGGASILQIAKAPFFLGIVMCFLSLLCSLFLEPYANNQFEKYKWLQTRKFVQSFIESKLKEKYFIYDFIPSEKNKIAFYFDEVSSSKQDFAKVFISQKNEISGDKSIILADHGTLSRKKMGDFSDYIFTLRQGEMYLAKKNKAVASSQDARSLEWTVVTFDEINISLMSLFKNKFNVESQQEKDIRSKYPLEYWQILQEQRASDPQWRQKPDIVKNHNFFVQQLLFPFSCIFLSLIGICLGVQDPRRKQVAGYFGLGIVVFCYYSAFTLCQQLAAKGILHPAVNLLVTPALLLFILCVLLQWRLKYPPATKFLEFVRQEIRLFYRKKKT